MAFRKGEGVKTIDVAAFEHAVRLWTIVLEISVMMAQFPSKEIAQLSYDYRTLGLGFANIGGLLMSAGIPYDSREGRAIAGAVSAVMTGVSYSTSAEMAGELGAFPEYAANKDAMLRVIRNHRRAAHGETAGYEKLATPPVPLDLRAVTDGALADAAKRAWDDALAMGKEFGFRNAQATVIAPTGTIGLVMDCDTTGVEPDFALVKFKTLAGGGYSRSSTAACPRRWPISAIPTTRSTPSSPMRWAMARWRISAAGSITTPCAARASATSRSGVIEAALESASMCARVQQMDPGRQILQGTC